MTNAMTSMTNAAGLADLTPGETIEAVLTAVAMHTPIMVEGSMGIGKSSVVRRCADLLHAAHYGLTPAPDGTLRDAAGEPTDVRPHFIDLRGSLLDPVDLRGLPVPDLKARLTQWLTPDFLPFEGSDRFGEFGLIFLDELTRAPVMVQNALLQAVLDHAIGDRRLKRGWSFVSAANRAADGGVGVGKLDLALAKRFVRVTMVPDLAQWLAWGAASGVHPVVLAFHNFRQANPNFPNAFYAPNPRDPASPEPRAWEFVSRLMWEHERSPKGDRVILAMVGGTVGASVATEFLAFLARYAEISRLGDVLADPARAPLPADVQTTYAIASQLAARATEDNLAAVITYLERLPAEFGAYAVRDATLRAPSLKETAAYVSWAIRHQDELK